MNLVLTLFDGSVTLWLVSTIFRTLSKSQATIRGLHQKHCWALDESLGRRERY